MGRIQLNRSQWWLVWTTYAGVLLIQRDNLRDANTATAFLILGALLLLWRMSQSKSAPSPADARGSVLFIGVMAALLLGPIVLNNWPSSRGGAATPGSTIERSPARPVITEQPDAVRSPEPDTSARLPLDGRSAISPLDLLQEFETNDYAAEQKYSGGFVQIAGDVVEVGGGGNEEAFLQLSLGRKRVDPMPALFPDRNAGQIRGLKKGDRVTLSCLPRYDSDIDNVTLNDCTRVK